MRNVPKISIQKPRMLLRIIQTYRLAKFAERSYRAATQHRCDKIAVMNSSNL